MRTAVQQAEAVGKRSQRQHRPRGSARHRLGACLAALAAALVPLGSAHGQATPPATPQPEPSVIDPALVVRTVVSGLTQPTGMAFLGDNDLLVLEKSTGRVLRVTNGAVQGVALDAAVNFGSERGMLGIALHPNFATNRQVFLYWTQSASGVDNNNLAELGSLWGGTEPLRMNRVDRFVWNGSTLVFDRNLLRIRSYQADAGQPLRGNHDGGVIRFGQDGKLYVIVGDVGRRGWLQNLQDGPPRGELAPYAPSDDQFGGPAPDNNHLTGVILRVNDDGSTPADNPFFAFGAQTGGEVGANLQRIFSYGVRNSFGLAIDPLSGFVWNSQNGDDSYGELNRVEPGTNGGWVQLMGPVARVADFKAIETSAAFVAGGLQQRRWPPSLIADTPEQALARLFVLPGSRYADPQLSWRYELSPTAVGFASGTLGAQYAGDMFVGGALGPPAPNFAGGYLFRLRLTPDRRDFVFTDPRLEDRVADNTAKYDGTESESLLFGSNFGGVTDIQTGPNGNLYVLSVSRGTLYEIAPR